MTDSAHDSAHDTAHEPSNGSADRTRDAASEGTGHDSAARDDAAPRDGARADRAPRTGIVALLRETVIVVTIALALSLLVKTFLLQAFFIPSQSMEDTLLIGDRVIVSKLTPGPFDLEHGEVVVFTDPGGWLGPDESDPVDPGPLRKGLAFVGLLPNDSNNHLIKRIIGLPGDHVVFDKSVGKLTVNDQPIDESYVRPGSTPSEREFDITVPQGRIWVMGDNRQESEDSRYHDDGSGRTGSVPISDVTGRAVAIVWPLPHAATLPQPKAVFAKVPAPSSS